MSKKRSKFDSVKNDPLFQQQPGLIFDNLSPESVIELTEDQKMTSFVSRYLANEHPISRFKDYFEASVKGEAWELKELKLLYKKLVLSEKWSEEKFVAVVNSIYRDKQFMTEPTLDARGKMFDQGRLVSTEKTVSSRRKGRL